MEIIKEGRKQKGWAKEYECTGAGNKAGGCGAILLVEEGDFFQTSSSDYGGGTETFVTFRCPSCGVLTDVKDTPFHGCHLLNYREWLNTKA